jgi:hypothetical protein
MELTLLDSHRPAGLAKLVVVRHYKVYGADAATDKIGATLDG